ncbi:MAG: cell division protein CrgA [Bifidobacterium minimum]|nr:cell division protein CrgA [Bifidobacterium minimum]
MADEELPGTEPTGTNGGQDPSTPTTQTTDEVVADAATSAAQDDTDATPSSADDAATTDATGDKAAKDKDKDATDDDDLGLPMDKIDALLNANVDKDSLTPQMRRMMQRQSENSKRVEESIKGTRANPVWFVPLFCTLMVIGLVWAVVYYLSPGYPIPNIGAWNLVIAFAIIMAGFLMTMGWH